MEIEGGCCGYAHAISLILGRCFHVLLSRANSPLGGEGRSCQFSFERLYGEDLNSLILDVDFQRSGGFGCPIPRVSRRQTTLMYPRFSKICPWFLRK